MSYIYDRVKETTTTTGTGSITLAGAVAGFQSFSTAVTSGQQVNFVIENPADNTWEVGYGTFTSPSTLSRTNVFYSSSGGATVNFAAGTKYVYIDASSQILPDIIGTPRYVPPITPGGRLTLTSGNVPVTTSDVTGNAVMYYTPYIHNILPLYDGTRWHQVAFGETSHSPSITSQTTRTCNCTSGSQTLTLSSGTTTGLYEGQLLNGTGLNSCYIMTIDSSTTLTMSVAAASTQTGTTVTFFTSVFDVWAYINASFGVSLESTAWTTATSRATALSYQDGRLVKSTNSTRLYLGTVRYVTSGGMVDSKQRRGLWNMYNRVPRSLQVYDSGTSWTYSTNAWRPTNNNKFDRVEVLNGLSESSVSVQWMMLASNSTGATCAIGIAVDSSTPTTPYTASIGGGGVNYFFQPGVVKYDDYPGLGHHYIQAVENGLGDATASTFYGTTNAGSALMSGMTMA